MGIPIRERESPSAKAKAKATHFKNNYIQVRCSDQVRAQMFVLTGHSQQWPRRWLACGTAASARRRHAACVPVWDRLRDAACPLHLKSLPAQTLCRLLSWCACQGRGGGVARVRSLQCGRCLRTQHGEELTIRIKARCPFQMLQQVSLLRKLACAARHQREHLCERRVVDNWHGGGRFTARRSCRRIVIRISRFCSAAKS